MHQSIPAAPSISIFLPWMANSRQHFSLIAQSSSAILSILMFDFFFQLTSSLIVIYSAIPNKTSRSDHTSLWF